MFLILITSNVLSSGRKTPLSIDSSLLKSCITNSFIPCVQTFTNVLNMKTYTSKFPQCHIINASLQRTDNPKFCSVTGQRAYIQLAITIMQVCLRLLLLSLTMTHRHRSLLTDHIGLTEFMIMFAFGPVCVPSMIIVPRHTGNSGAQDSASEVQSHVLIQPSDSVPFGQTDEVNTGIAKVK